MINELIKEGRSLYDQIQRHYDGGYKRLPPAERISLPELDGWYSGVAAALEREYGVDSTQAVFWRDGLKRIQGEMSELVGRTSTRDGYFVQQHLTESLGLLAQIRLLQVANLSNSAALAFSALHPKIVQKCQPLFASASFDEAVLAAFRTIEEEVRTRSGAMPTDIGVALMSYALNSKTPRLRVSSIAAEQEGYHALFRGAIASFKNPVSHRTVGHVEAARVFELLAFASALMRILDDSAVEM